MLVIFFSSEIFSEALLQHRPLPEVPSTQDELSNLASLGFLHSLEGSGLRWTSRENLLINCQDEDGDPQLFVALYDFQAGGENQLSLKKSEQVSSLGAVTLLGWSSVSSSTTYLEWKFSKKYQHNQTHLATGGNLWSNNHYKA